MKKFVIEFIDPGTDCISSEFAFETTEVASLTGIVNPGQGDLRPSGTYDLNPSDLDQIEGLLGAQIERASEVALLRLWGSTDDLPYKVHSNRELLLMLKGEKPLAVFFEGLPANPDLYNFIPEHLFAPYVEAGLFLASEYIFTNSRGAEDRVVLYAAKGEEWRIKAFVLLQKTVMRSGWSEGLTRMEGSLLGYEDWQNDVFIDRFFKSRERGNAAVPASSSS